MTIEERTVLLYDTPCIITISHPSKTVWVAVGDYKGERIEVKGSSANAATKHWLDAAFRSGLFLRFESDRRHRTDWHFRFKLIAWSIEAFATRSE
jgi:hypothetical protein